MKAGIIYMATSPSGKSYIGQTVQKLNRRKMRHYNRSMLLKKDGSFLYTFKFPNALRKYQKQDWIWKVLLDNIPQHCLSLLEKWYINEIDTYNNGYNSTLGGEDNPMNYKIFRDKVSNANKGRKRTREQKLKISGENSHRYGKPSYTRGIPHTDETKRKISKSNKGKIFTPDHKEKISKTRKRNREIHPSSKLNMKIANEIRAKYSTGKYTYKNLAKEYDINKSSINAILNYKRWVK